MDRPAVLIKGDIRRLYGQGGDAHKRRIKILCRDNGNETCRMMIDTVPYPAEDLVGAVSCLIRDGGLVMAVRGGFGTYAVVIIESRGKKLATGVQTQGE